MLATTSTLLELEGNNAVLTGLLPALQAPKAGLAPWWLFWLLVILTVLAVVIWWWTSKTEEEETPAAGKAEVRPVEAEVRAAPVVAVRTPVPAAPPVVVETAVQAPAGVEAIPAPAAVAEVAPAVAARVEGIAVPPPAPAGPDDLVLLEGIGPKIAGLLKESGITTFNQLAATEVSQLQSILRTANLRMADPTTWPEQARLAAVGDWEALRVLQSKLRAGRRVE